MRPFGGVCTEHKYFGMEYLLEVRLAGITIPLAFSAHSACGPMIVKITSVGSLNATYRVDVSKSDWAQGYAKMTPTVAIFENGKSVKISEGMTLFPELKNRLTEHLKNANLEKP